MTLSDILNKSVRSIKSSSPEILVGIGIAGVPITSYLTARASFKAARKIDEVPDISDDWKVNFKENFKLTWRCYWPAVASGSLTVAAIIASSKASGRRTAAAFTAYSLTEKAFSEYKEHVIEQIGKGKEQKIRDEIAQKHVTERPPSKEVIMVGQGAVLCCELWTHRYFRSDMETLRKAENEINHMINTSAGLIVNLSDFYDILDLPHTSTSDKIGWDSDKLLELEFSTVLSEDGEPCLAFDYNYIRPNNRSVYN